MSSKKSSKKIIAPMKIKQEKDNSEKNEPRDLCSYIDDRVELLQQVFVTLKTSKIKTMAPDCIQDMQTDEIKELLLDELLGISTKRLRSIIQGTDCPTDTDSSDDAGIIEHISLDEISDETENEFGSDGDSRNKNAPEQKDSSQMSVLELLELQARARAIRSQLALEPVKEEIIKTDKDNLVPILKEKHKKSKHDKSKDKSEKRKSNHTEKSSNPIKPVRNYRQPKSKEKKEKNGSETNVNDNNNISNATEETQVEIEATSATVETIIEAADESLKNKKDSTEIEINVNVDIIDNSQNENTQITEVNNKTNGKDSEKEIINEMEISPVDKSVVIKKELIISAQNEEKPKKIIKLNRDCIRDQHTVKDNTINANKSSDSVDELNLHFSDTEKELLEKDVHKKSSKFKNNKKLSSSSDDCISIQNGDESPFVISSESD